MVTQLKSLIGNSAGNTATEVFSNANTLSGATQFVVSKRKLSGGLRGGMEIIEVDNGRLKYWLLPERGMGIWKVWLDGIEIGWQSPLRGPVHPQFVDLSEASGLGWLDGFDELLCRCGLESNGAPEFDKQGRLKYPLHGKIANLPAYQVEARHQTESDEICIAGRVEESRFQFQKLSLNASVSTRPDSSEIRVHDSVTNISATPGEFQLLYHINFGAPLLEAGAEVVAPVKTLVPRTHRAIEGIDQWSTFGAPEAGFREQVYFMELFGDAHGQTQVLLRNSAATQGVSIHFNLLQLPCFTLWKNTAATRDGYVAGLEPGTNFPNPRSFEQAQNRVIPLLPGESKEFDVRLEFHPDASSVTRAVRKIADYQALGQPQIYRTLQRGWSIEAS
jgi:hypothetical protein